VPAVQQARGHHPGARARPCARARPRPRAGAPEGSSHGDQPVGPRRQGSRVSGSVPREQVVMNTRIDSRFAAVKQEGRAALVTFTMAGDPDYDTSVAIAQALPRAGADLIELGMPFTDPMADGPSVQAAGVRALKSGQTMRKTLALVGAVRQADDATPIVLM